METAKIISTESFNEAKNLKHTELVNLIGNPGETQSIYKNSGLIIRGGNSFVYIKGEEPKEGILAKTNVIPVIVKSQSNGRNILIALKLIPVYSDDSIGYTNNAETAAYAKLSILESICEYYPKIYGVYYGPSIKHIAWTNYLTRDKVKPLGFLYMEMELVDKKLHLCYGKVQSSIPDSIVFEMSLGQWATSTIANISVDDDRLYHHVLKDVDYSRAYHIGKHIYLFSHSEMPKRIDLDSCSDYTRDAKMNLGFKVLQDEKAGLTLEARSFFSKLNDFKVKHNIFDLFFACFNKYIIQEVDLPLDQKIKHFTIPLEFVNQSYEHNSASAAPNGSAHQLSDSFE